MVALSIHVGLVCGMTKDQYEKVKGWIKYFEPYDATRFTFSEGGGGGADIGPLANKF